MTIFSSKKPPNNNKDLSSNSTNQQQQQTSTSNISRTRLSRDDDNSPSHPTNSNEESNLVCDNNLPSSSSTTNTILNSITTAPTSKRKSHYHHQTTVKQARRRGGSVGEKLISNTSVTNVTCNNSPSSSLPMENNLTSTSNTNEHLSVPSTSTSALTTVNSDEQCNSEDEYEQTTLKYDRNNLNEVSNRLMMMMIRSEMFCFI